MSATPLPAAQHQAQPWKNGLGVSRMIAEFPQGAGFDAVLWQVGSTEIGADCPFSSLPGLDRQFMVIEGAGVELSSVDEETGASWRERIERLQPPYAFRGDWRTSCRLLNGPVRVFNVMTRRGKFSAAVEIAPAATVRNMKKNEGEILIAVELPTLDAWLLDSPGKENCDIEGTGERVLVRIRADER